MNSIAIYGNDYYDRPTFRFSHLVEIGRSSYRDLISKLRIGGGYDRDIPSNIDITVVLRRGLGNHTVSASVSLRGWKSIEMSVIEVGVKMPVVGVFPKMNKD
jgi:hypothetical protein